MAAIPEEAPAPDSRPTLGMVAELFNEARREKRKLLPRWNKFYRLLRNRAWCVDPQTEALTKRGWVNGFDLTTQDEILSCTPEGQLIWSPVLHIYRGTYQGPMCRIQTRNIDALVTPNHKWLLKDGALVPTTTLGKARSFIRVMGEAVEALAESQYSNAFVELVGWVLTEGCYMKNVTGNIEIGITQKPGEGADRIRRALKESGARFREREETRGSDRGLMIGFYVTGEVRDAIVAIAPQKVPLYSFLLELTGEQRRLLIDTMLAGDGHIRPDGSSDFFQLDTGRLNAFVWLCTVEGITTYTSPRLLSRYATHYGRDLWNVHLKQVKVTDGYWVRKGKKPMYEEQYEGMVWCPTTLHGSFVARRNGKVYITGNSDFRESWVPSPSASEIFPTIATLVSWMTDQRPRTFVSAAPDTMEFVRPPNAELVQSMTKDMQQSLDSWWINRDMGTQTQMALYDTFTFGSGIMKTGWDSTIEFGQGDATARRVDPYAILPDPAASSFDDCRYVLEVRKVPLYELRARFGQRANRIKGSDGYSEADERPQVNRGLEIVRESLASTGVTGAFPGTSTPGVPPRFGTVAQGVKDYTEMVLFKELWVRNTRTEEIPFIENGKISHKTWEIPYWEYIAEAGGVILNEDTTNPFEHGQLPYVRFPMVEIGEFWSISLIEHLGQAQVALNRLLAALQMNAEITGNPIFLDPSNSGITRTKIINRPGGRLEYQNGEEPKWLQPPTMSPNVNDLIGFWRDEIDRISGISAVARGASMRRREPAQAVDVAQEASLVRIRAVLRNMEEGLRRVAYQTASNMSSFYIEPRTISKVGPSGEQGYLQLGNRHFFYPDIVPGDVNLVPIHFDVWMESGSTLPISRQAKLAELMSLHFAGLVDPETILENADIPNRARALEYAKQQAQIAAEAGERTGKNPRR